MHHVKGFLLQENGDVETDIFYKYRKLVVLWWCQEIIALMYKKLPDGKMLIFHP